MARILTFSGKCNDCFGATFNGKEISGYVPLNLGIGGGEYISISIDVDTGKVIGWETPPEKVLNTVFYNSDDE